MSGLPERIEALVADARAVKRLRPPLLRAAGWLGFAAVVLAAFVMRHGIDPDSWLRLADPGFVLPAAGSLAAGVLAAIAAFQVSLPDRPLNWLLLPAPAALLWVASVGVGCLATWVDLPADPAERAHAVECFQAVSAISLPLLLSLLFMLRHAFGLRPVAVALAASFAVAALGTSVLMLIHPHGTSLMILGWNLGMVGLVVGLGRLLAPGLRLWATRVRIA